MWFVLNSTVTGLPDQIPPAPRPHISIAGGSQARPMLMVEIQLDRKRLAYSLITCRTRSETNKADTRHFNTTNTALAGFFCSNLCSYAGCSRWQGRCSEGRRRRASTLCTNIMIEWSYNVWGWPGGFDIGTETWYVSIGRIRRSEEHSGPT